MIWKARSDIGLEHLTDHVMEIAEFCLGAIARKDGFRLVTAPIQCPNVCFWYIPTFMRDKEEDEKWWETMHKVCFNYLYQNILLIVCRSLTVEVPVGSNSSLQKITTMLSSRVVFLW